MKKIYIFTAVLALLTLSLNAQLQAKKKAVVKQQATADKIVTPANGSLKAPNRADGDLSVTVNEDATQTNEYIPVYGYYSERTAKDQIIYTASQLNIPAGSQITSLTFYTSQGLAFAGGTMTVSLGTTTESSFSSNTALSSTWTQVASFTPASISTNEWTIDFTTDFTYDGGNLIVQIEHENANSGSSHSYFYGAEVSSMSLYSYNSAVYQSWNGTIYNFQPKATFTYIGGSDPRITASKSSLTFSTIPGAAASQTVTIGGYNLTDGITATLNDANGVFSVTPTSLGSNGGDLTINYSPSATGSHSATLTLSSTGAEDVNITLNGTCVQEETICDGTDQNNFLPLYGYYYDAKQVNQMIYPADKLTSLVGTKITSMTFYSPHIYFYNGKYTVKVGTTSQTSFSSIARNTADLTATVASDLSATAGGTELTITFDAPFEYNGGNLIVDFEETATGSWGSNQTYFYGENQSTNTSFNTQGSSLNNNGVYTGTNSGLRSFLPKVTFTYEDGEPRHDLSVALSAPSQAGAGSNVNVTATVTNNGNQTETGYTVTISAGGNVISTQTASEALAPGATATFTAQNPTNAADAGQTVNFTANVTCADDADATNNNAAASTSLSTIPAPENVAATTSSNQSATMTWDAPSTLPDLPGTVTWDFEEETDFTAFTIIDADGDGYNWYWHYNDGVTEGDQMNVHQGAGAVYSESYNNATKTALNPENWMISPKVTFGNTLSLWACGQDGDYPAEVFGVYVCVGDYNGVNDFQQVGNDITVDATMTEYTIDLSQYEGQQGYFAIVHHNVTDQFILDIDDISYETLVPTAPVSYNIYLDGEFMGNVDANTFSYTFNNVSGEHECAVSAVYPGGIESAAVPTTFATQAQTAAPFISSEVVGNNVVITATGDGTVTLNVPGYPTATGNGSASITVPRQMQDYTVTATATAQEEDKLVSETETMNVLVSGMANDGWRLMDGTYTGDQALNFIDDATQKRIVILDQFFESTMYNEHPSEYEYIFKEDGYTHTSNPVTVPVFKTNSVMNGLYTQNEVDTDDKYDENKLTANALNSKMTFDTQVANEMYRYQLYRGALNEDPVIDLDHTISQLLESNDLFTEQLNIDGVYPTIDHMAAGTFMRNDRYFNSTISGPFDTPSNPYNVEDADVLSYVPVIWTMGFRTGRLDDKNNSYGSDIKRNMLGGVDVVTKVIKNESANNKFDVNGVEYYVYAPEITLDAELPTLTEAHDGDTYQYEPYMYRVWCTYNGARNFAHDSEGHLIDDGAINAPFLVGEVKANTLDDASHAVIGGDLGHNAEQTMWSFAAPKNTAGQFEFVIRFYYKKNTTDASAATEPAGLRGNRDGDTEDFYVFETRSSVDDIVTGINELWNNGKVVLSRTYVNAQGMQSDKPFDGLNIVVTRYSDGTTRTTKLVR